MPEQIGLKSSFYMPMHTHADNNTGGKLNGNNAIMESSINLSITGSPIIGVASAALNNYKFFEKTFSGVKTSNTSYTPLWTFTARANIYFTIEFNVIMAPGVDNTGAAAIREATVIISPEYSFNEDGLIQKFTWSSYYQIGHTYTIALKSNTAGVYASLLSVKFYGYYHPQYGANFLYQYCVSPPAPALTT